MLSDKIELTLKLLLDKALIGLLLILVSCFNDPLRTYHFLVIHFNKFSWKWLINSKIVGDRTVGVGWAEVGLPYNCINFVSLRKCLKYYSFY